MGRKNFKAGALTAPLPAVMVTVGDMEESNIITIGWTGILSTIPPRTYISVRPERHSHKLIKKTGEFVINLTTSALAYATDYAGIYTGAKVDKFKELGLTKLKSECVAPPTIAECPLALECRLVETIPMGTHDVFIADIISVSCDDSILDEKGKLCFDKAGLMAYAHGEYYALGEKLGKFGFSTDKGGKKVRTDKASSNKPKSDNKPTQKLGSGKKSKSATYPTNSKGSLRVDGITDSKGEVTEANAEKKRPFYMDIKRGKKRSKR